MSAQALHIPGESSLIPCTDNGPRFISMDFNNPCAEFGVEHEYIPIDAPNNSAHI